MVLLLKYFVKKNLVFTYGFIIEISCEQKLWGLPMVLRLQHFVNKNLVFIYGFIVEMFRAEKFGVYL